MLFTHIANIEIVLEGNVAMYCGHSKVEIDSIVEHQAATPPQILLAVIELIILESVHDVMKLFQLDSVVRQGFTPRPIYMTAKS